MKKIELYKGIYSSRLGFGCAPILGSVDAATAKRAIEVSLDCGINHFDLARSYGYGESEQFVGKILKGRRDQVVLASKFGIKANWKANLLKPLKPVVRMIRGKKKTGSAGQEISAAKAVENNKPGSFVPDYFHERIPLTGQSMTLSLEKTLKELNTDYVDFFMIHEPQETIVNLDELALTAERLKTQGKIRAWGLAFMKSQEYLHTDYLNAFDILQFNNSPGLTTYNQTLKDRGNEANIFFSPMRGEMMNLTPSEKLKRLLVDFSNSVVLCSMFNERHIKANADLVM